MYRKHQALVRLLARLLRAAGYQAFEEVWEPRWDRPVRDGAGRQKRDREGNPLWERARLDLKLMAPPEEPLVYGDVVVSHPGAPSNVREAAAEDGGAAEKAVWRKQARYPPEQVPSARLVVFSVETGGRWGKDALTFLKRAAGRVAQRHPGLAGLEGEGGSVVFSSWLRQLSCVLQKENAAALRGAAAGGARAVRGASNAPRTGEAEEEETAEDWLAEQVEDLLVRAAAAAAAGA